MKFNLKFCARTRILCHKSQRILYGAGAGTMILKFYRFGKDEARELSGLHIFKFRLFAL